MQYNANIQMPILLQKDTEAVLLSREPAMRALLKYASRLDFRASIARPTT